MKIGLGTYALAWSIGVPGYPPEYPMDIYSFLSFAHQYGFRLVQIADNIPLHQFDDLELRKIREESRNLDIEIEVGMRGMTVEKVKRYLEISRILGSSILRVVIDEKEYQPDLNVIHKVIKSLIPMLEAENIKLAIENHDRLKASEFSEIIEKANNEFVGICLDSVNSIGADEGFEIVFNTLARHTINLHLKDYLIERKSHMMGFDISGMPAGKGRMPIPEIINHLEKYKKCKSLVLELWTPFKDDLGKTIMNEQEWVKESANYLFKNIK